jgi:hypothetical protein
MGEITKSPLSWPNNVARTPPHQRQVPRFGDWSITQASVLVLQEINRLNERGNPHYEDGSVIISTNLRYKLDGMPYGIQPQPADPGAAVYFNLRFARGGNWHDRPVVLSCDKWVGVEWNRLQYRLGEKDLPKFVDLIALIRAATIRAKSTAPNARTEPPAPKP